jgi:hypothetical protein
MSCLEQLIDRTLALLSHAHGPEAFVTVRLSGLVHTTDRLAMRSIAVQLREQGFGDAAQVEGEAEGDYVRGFPSRYLAGES